MIDPNKVSPSYNGSYRESMTPGKTHIIASRQKWKCYICGEILGNRIDIDHNVPLWKCKLKGYSKEDANHLRNLVAVHPGCHGEKTTREEVERHDRIRARKKRKSPYFEEGSILFTGGFIDFESFQLKRRKAEARETEGPDTEAPQEVDDESD